MARITVGEFVEDIMADVPILRDGHELGLIIDESNGRAQWCARVFDEIARQVPVVTLPVSALRDPEAALRAMSVASGEALVLLEAKEALSCADYEALRGVVEHHGLYAWNHTHTQGRAVRFNEQIRFVLFSSRAVLEASVGEFPHLWEVIGTTMAVDGSQKEVA